MNLSRITQIVNRLACEELFLRVQHTFGAIEMADRNFNGGMWDKITLVGAEFAYFDRGGIRDSFKVKLQVTNVTQRTATLPRRDRI